MLHFHGPYGVKCNSTDIRKPQISVSDRTFDFSGPRATDTMSGVSLVRSWSRRSFRNCMTPWTQMFRDWISSRTNLSGIPLLSFFTSSRKQQSSGSEKLWKFTPSFPSRDCSALTRALKPSDVHGTSLILSPGLSAHCETSLYPHQKTTRL